MSFNVSKMVCDNGAVTYMCKSSTNSNEIDQFNQYGVMTHSYFRQGNTKNFSDGNWNFTLSDQGQLKNGFRGDHGHDWTCAGTIALG